MGKSLQSLMRKRVTQVALVAVTGLTLAACSSGGSSSGSTTTTTSVKGGSSSTSTTSAASTPTTSSASASVASKLQTLMESTQGVKDRTFALTYTETSSASGSGKTLTFAQDPPKFLFEVASAIIVDTGTETYACSNTGSGADYCETSGATTTEIAPLENLITGQTVSSQLASVREGILSKLAGVNASFSSASFAGQPSSCVSGSQGANTFKYCVTNSGVLAYAGGSSVKTYGSLTLVTYSTSPPASDFTVPAGATVVTTP